MSDVGLSHGDAFGKTWDFGDVLKPDDGNAKLAMGSKTSSHDAIKKTYFFILIQLLFSVKINNIPVSLKFKTHFSMIFGKILRGYKRADV